MAVWFLIAEILDEIAVRASVFYSRVLLVDLDVIYSTNVVVKLISACEFVVLETWLINDLIWT